MKLGIERGLAMLAAGLLLACGADEANAPLAGVLERDRLELVAEAQEEIVEIGVREGQRVVAGQVLVRLDEARVAVEISRLEAERERARARLAEIERGTRKERVREGLAGLAGAESSLAVAETDLARRADLLAKGAAPAEEVDQARRVRDEALARRDQAKAALDALLAGATSEEVRQAAAALAVADAAVAAAELTRQRLTIRAPRPGTVDALPFEVGEKPPPGAVVVVLLAESAPYARVFVPEPRLAGVALGAPARVRADGLAAELAGCVRRVSGDAAFTPFYALTSEDRSRLSFEAEVEIVGADGSNLPSGLPVEVVLEGAAPGSGPCKDFLGAAAGSP